MQKNGAQQFNEFRSFPRNRFPVYLVIFLAGENARSRIINIPVELDQVMTTALCNTVDVCLIAPGTGEADAAEPGISRFKSSFKNPIKVCGDDTTRPKHGQHPATFGNHGGFDFFFGEKLRNVVVKALPAALAAQIRRGVLVLELVKKPVNSLPVPLPRAVGNLLKRLSP